MDLLELYSFSINLNIYTFLYFYTCHKPLFEFLFTNFLGNLFLYYFLNINIYKFINHNYWKKNFKTIAGPQLIHSISNISILNNNYNFVLIFPINILIQYFINISFKNEFNESKNLRYILTFIYFILFLF